MKNLHVKLTSGQEKNNGTDNIILRNQIIQYFRHFGSFAFGVLFHFQKRTKIDVKGHFYIKELKKENLI